MPFSSARQRKRVMGYQLRGGYKPKRFHPEHSHRVYCPKDGEIIQHGENRSLILDGVLYDPLSVHHPSLESARKEQGILVSRGEEAIVRQISGNEYEVWVRSR